MSEDKGERWENLREEWRGLPGLRQLNHNARWFELNILDNNRKYRQALIKGKLKENPNLKEISLEEGEHRYNKHLEEEGIDIKHIREGRIVLRDDGIEYYCPTERGKPEITYKQYKESARKEVPTTKPKDPSL